MRVVALWFPDWPVQAITVSEDTTATGDRASVEEPVAIVRDHAVKVCSLSARRAGVRRGMKTRQAQSVCPGLRVYDDDPERDARWFEPVAAGLDDVAASVEVLRPGLVIIAADAAARFHGGENTVVEMLIDAAARRGVDCFAGIADEIPTALIAARTGMGTVVGEGASASFLSPQPLGVLAAEVSLGCEIKNVEKFADLGITTLGELAALPAGAVVNRFGLTGQRCRAIAAGQPDRRVAPVIPGTDLSVGLAPEEPIERVDAAAFAARALADRLHHRLRDEGVVCHRLKVTAEIDGSKQCSRTWRTREALTEATTADRVRWQLDGWLTSGGQGAITALTLEPVEIGAPDVVGGLWGDRNDDAAVAARKVANRLASTLGTEAVLRPVAVGGRGVAERIELVPFDEEFEANGWAGHRWPGRIPGPLPARLGGGVFHPASRVRLIDATATPVTVTAEAVLSGIPYALQWGRRFFAVTAWAGPWPVDEGWWSQPGGVNDTGLRLARLQLVGRVEGSEAAADQGTAHAWLLLWRGRQWRVEASYG